jgi:Sec-independent protein translocase protein TatA
MPFGFGFGELALILVIVFVVFGAKDLRSPSQRMIPIRLRER